MIITEVSKRQTVDNTQEDDSVWSDFRAYATCPPTKGVWIRGGLCHWLKSDYWVTGVGDELWFDGNTPDGRAWTVPSKQYDFDDESNLVTTKFLPDSWAESDQRDPLHFANPYWYKPATLLLLAPLELIDPDFDGWDAWLLCDDEGNEYEMPEEAEAQNFQYSELHYWPSCQYFMRTGDYGARRSGMPVAGVILRNNGVIGYGRNFMPIDMANRGRSYLWPIDLRTQPVET